MSESYLSQAKRLIIQIGDCFKSFDHNNELSVEDTILLKDSLGEYAEAVANVINPKRVQPQEDILGDIKDVFHTVARVRLKYLVMWVNKYWGEYRIYHKTISPFIDIGRYSPIFGAACTVLDDSRSLSKEGKIARYDEFVTHIAQVEKLKETIKTTEKDCRANIERFKESERKQKSGWFKRNYQWICIVIPLIVALFLLTDFTSIKGSIIGRCVKKLSNSDMFRQECGDVNNVNK